MLHALRLLSILVLIGAALAAPPPQGNDSEAPLVGSWLGSSGPLRGKTLTLRGDRTCSVDAVEGQWKVYGKTKIRLRLPDETLRGPFELTGDRLSIEFDGRKARFKRVGGAAPTPSASPPSAATAAAGSPFGAGAAPIDVTRWAGTFEGGGITLVSRAARPGVEGTLERKGQRWAFRGLVVDGSVAAAVATAAGDVSFSLVALSDGVELRTVGLRAQLTRVQGGSHPAPNGNPLTPRPGGSSAAKTPTLGGLADGPAARHSDAGDRLSFDLLEPWKAVDGPDGTIAIDLGFRAGQIADAMVLLDHGRLTSDELGKSPAQILDQYESELRQGWAEQGLRMKRPRKGATAVRAGRLDGAQQSWHGTLANGDPMEAWVGAVTTRGHYAIVACLTLTHRRDDFLPGTRRILATLKYDPPERSVARERQLVGKRISTSETGDSGFFGTVYEFHDDARVLCKTMMSGGVGVGSIGGQTEEWGSYMVAGETLYIELESGEVTATVILSGDRVTAIRHGGRTHQL